MKEQTGETYSAFRYAKALFATVPKVGKTATLVASSLGLLPWQERGGLVTKPSNLHVVTADSAALDGVKAFLTKTCNASKEALAFKVYNFEDDCRRVAVGQGTYECALYNDLISVIKRIHSSATNGVHVLLISSLTGFALALEREMMGPPGGPEGKSRGYGDQSKWQLFGARLNELRNYAQMDNLHCLWEGHVYQASGGQNKDDPPKQTLSVSGRTGANFAFNVAQVFRIDRKHGQKYEGTKCDRVYFDTQPSFDFMTGGRGFNENLDAKETDLTAMFEKLSLKVGNWGA